MAASPNLHPTYVAGHRHKNEACCHALRQKRSASLPNGPPPPCQGSRRGGPKKQNTTDPGCLPQPMPSSTHADMQPGTLAVGSLLVQPVRHEASSHVALPFARPLLRPERRTGRVPRAWQMADRRQGQTGRSAISGPACRYVKTVAILITSKTGRCLVRRRRLLSRDPPAWLHCP
ncbi:uncharacterized protein K452DRAFT_170785 [Aplosporella prunicola CBS 121167]|uniref:Uncharacterized protein n=1 Tax=Aplosporella prunicola CBS 121167 TaxID=1176127 RepID=A0A6A6BJB5_9PEZI|nr:uncharacterized protein K452DRAFT_170785 [Aplosporella prunicola CBS 121167]KAF2143415.1 hypothetical protein K452DRAFT_170785 [Aplosporella prunicola CBS 121167]